MDEEPELRPSPPPRCRGIPLGDGNYTGCAYGYGDLAPFTGPRDCPVCNGSGFEGHIETTLPHSDFGDPECCGCLNGVIRGDQADIICNECGTVLRTVPAAKSSMATLRPLGLLNAASGRVYARLVGSKGISRQLFVILNTSAFTKTSAGRRP